jgi:hypothetical protein
MFVSMRHFPEIGVNPSTEHHGSPAGIYAYPLASAEVCRQIEADNLPYVNWARYAALIRISESAVVLSDEATEAEVESARTKLSEIMGAILTPQAWKEAQRIAAKNTHVEHAAGILYKEAHVAASLISASRSETPQDAINMVKLNDVPMYGEDKERPLIWNSVLRRIGFDAVLDNGTKFIYNVEPYQICFLTKTAIGNYELFRNGRSAIHGHGKEIQSSGHLFRLIQSGDLHFKAAMNFIAAILSHREPAADDTVAFESYNPAIRLSHAQVKTVMDFFHDKNPEEVEKYVQWAGMFSGNVIYNIIGDRYE